MVYLFLTQSLQEEHLTHLSSIVAAKPIALRRHKMPSPFDGPQDQGHVEVNGSADRLTFWTWRTYRRSRRQGLRGMAQPLRR
jgi:hypothetical protein